MKDASGRRQRQAPSNRERGELVFPILRAKYHSAPSVFEPHALLREARRQKSLPLDPVPEICVRDPDGDILRHLRRTGVARLSPSWACYHTELYEFERAGSTFGIIGCAVGAPFAVLLAEQLFVSGCGLLVSITSAGQLTELAEPPYFVLIDRALRDEGTSYHYLAASDFSFAGPAVLRAMEDALAASGLAVVRGGTWTTDAPFRETETAIAAARKQGLLAVEMEAAALYAFAQARGRKVVCFAHVTNSMGRSEGDFEKGDKDGAEASLDLIACTASILPRLRTTG